MTTRVRF